MDGTTTTTLRLFGTLVIPTPAVTDPTAPDLEGPIPGEIEVPPPPVTSPRLSTTTRPPLPPRNPSLSFNSFSRHNSSVYSPVSSPRVTHTPSVSSTSPNSAIQRPASPPVLSLDGDPLDFINKQLAEMSDQLKKYIQKKENICKTIELYKETPDSEEHLHNISKKREKLKQDIVAAAHRLEQLNKEFKSKDAQSDYEISGNSYSEQLQTYFTLSEENSKILSSLQLPEIPSNYYETTIQRQDKQITDLRDAVATSKQREQTALAEKGAALKKAEALEQQTAALQAQLRVAQRKHQDCCILI